MALPESVFADTAAALFSHRYEVEIHVGTLVGGTPHDRKVAEGWIRSKMGLTTEDAIRAEVERVMAETGAKPDAAAEQVARDRHLTGFKRDYNTPLARSDREQATTTGFVLNGVRKIFTPEEALATFGELIIEARQIKAMLKEAAMVGVASGHIDGTKWGKTSKAMKGFLAEHLFVEEEVVYLERTEPDTIDQSFVHTFRGSSIKLEEKLHDVVVRFTLIADFDFNSKVKDFFAIVFAIAEKNGLGASRSQGFGRFSTIKFVKVASDAETTKKATKRAKEIIEEDRAREAARAELKGSADAIEDDPELAPVA